MDTDKVALEPQLRAALAECALNEPFVVRYPLVRSRQDVASAYEMARKANGIVVHALFDSRLRRAARLFQRELHVHSIDLVGPLIASLADLLEVPPSTKPELFLHLTEEYFRRIEAIEFAVARDDGLRTHELDRAEIILVGVDVTGKAIEETANEVVQLLHEKDGARPTQ